MSSGEGARQTAAGPAVDTLELEERNGGTLLELSVGPVSGRLVIGWGAGWALEYRDKPGAGTLGTADNGDQYILQVAEMGPAHVPVPDGVHLIGTRWTLASGAVRIVVLCTRPQFPDEVEDEARSHLTLRRHLAEPLHRSPDGEREITGATAPALLSDGQTVAEFSAWLLDESYTDPIVELIDPSGGASRLWSVG